MKYTLNQIIALLQTFANNHLQITSFGYGEDYDIEASGAKQAPLMWANVVNANRSKNELVISFKVVFLDLCEEDLTNENEILSDTLQTALDFIAEFQDSTYTNNGLYFTTDNAITPVHESFDNAWSGWSVDFSFRQQYYNDYCQIPK